MNSKRKSIKRGKSRVPDSIFDLESYRCYEVIEDPLATFAEKRDAMLVMSGLKKKKRRKKVKKYDFE